MGPPPTGRIHGNDRGTHRVMGPAVFIGAPIGGGPTNHAQGQGGTVAARDHLVGHWETTHVAPLAPTPLRSRLGSTPRQGTVERRPHPGPCRNILRLADAASGTGLDVRDLRSCPSGIRHFCYREEQGPCFLPDQPAVRPRRKSSVGQPASLVASRRTAAVIHKDSTRP